MGIQTSLDAVTGAQRLIDALRLSDDLAFVAGRDVGVRTMRILEATLAGSNQLAAIAATHALAQVFDQQADAILTRLLSDDRPYLREHAAWVLGSRLPRPAAIGRLVEMTARGGFAGMLAQRSLEQWSGAAPELVAVGLESALIGVVKESERSRLVETLGLVRDHIATRPLVRFARDVTEPESVRAAAISALGQRRQETGMAEVLDQTVAAGGPLADIARLALADLSFEEAHSSAPGTGLTAVQLFLHADIDPELSQVGSGDNGGIATLLVRLGDALVDAPGADVTRVLTLSRGPVAGALAAARDIAERDEGHLYGTIPLLSEPVSSSNAWPLRVAARRGIRRVLRAAGAVDVIHLRMADVGSLAAADVARELDIPVVFTVAPDPHAVINSMNRAGQLTAQNFGDVDSVEHFWFRAHLVQQLAGNAAHSVLFPRPNLADEMRELVGIDVTQHPERHTIVPEGIDLDVVDRAVAEAEEFSRTGSSTPQLDALADLLSALPAERRDLPLLVSVGRFHRVKGMATIVDAWANGPLRERANLLLIGGDLSTPSADERQQLDLIDAVIPRDHQLAAGLVLSGHRSNDTVARWVAAARYGIRGLVAPRGVYVCGSLKEEFGIALLEAMATGLMVVAPDSGGPATYVEDGVTGILTTTWDVVSLRDAMASALELSVAEMDDDRARRSRETVAQSFTIQAMASALGSLYTRVHYEDVAFLETLVASP